MCANPDMSTLAMIYSKLLKFFLSQFLKDSNSSYDIELIQRLNNLILKYCLSFYIGDSKNNVSLFFLAVL
jgi:hypothetical protein